MVEDSILNSMKHLLGVDKAYDAFDPGLIMHINGVFTILSQLGVPKEGLFSIQGASETWSSFFADADQIELVKTYMYLRVRLIFDPPTTSFQLDAFRTTMSEYEWRISVIVFDYIDYTVPVDNEI